jgi:hypothetical protein
MERPGDPWIRRWRHATVENIHQAFVLEGEADAEFAAQMEEVLETYEEAYDPESPGTNRRRFIGGAVDGDPLPRTTMTWPVESEAPRVIE